MLESYAVVSMCRSADNLGRAVPLRDAHQTSTQGAWRPRDEVRATSHRPCRFAAPICADSLGALDGDPCRLRARTSCQSAFRWVGCHAVCAPTHLIGGSIPWRIKRRQGHALRGRRAIVKEGEILLLRPLIPRTSTWLQAENRGEKRGSVAMPTEAFIAAGSSASLGIIFCCWFRFLWSASQALAVRQILSSVAMV